ERTLRFAALAAGDDPDTLIRRAGAGEFAAILAAARPMATALFEMLRGGVDNGSPEHRAGFRARLEAAAERIPVRALAAEYRRTLLDRFFAERRRGTALSRPAPPRPIIAEGGQAAERGRILLAILLCHPGLCHRVESALTDLALPPWLDSLRDAIFRWVDQADVLDSTGLIDHLTHSGMASEVARALAGKPFPLPACASEGSVPAEAEAGWWHFYRLMHEHRLNEDIAAAERELRETMSEAAQRRLVALKAAQAASAGAEHDEAGP
ncbi:MAG: DNA primase, partial [Acetobacteraceae bacterium]|nr:DNA primase [Acetobacteraceae bacterium]